MKRYDFCPDGYFDSLYDTFSHPFGDVSCKSDCIAAEKIKSGLRDAVGLDRIPLKKEKPDVKVLCSERRGSVTQFTLSAEICEGLAMLCYVLVPDRPDGTGIAALCGHGYGARQIIRQSKSGSYRTFDFIDRYQKNFALALAREGHTVIVPEFIGFGEARLKKDMFKPFYASSCETVSHHALVYGFTAAALRIYQAMCCIGILTEKYGCGRIGCMGISGGGLVALYTACLDDRIEKVCVSGYINTFRTSILAMWHCPDNYIPGILSVGDMYDFASALAPKKLMMQCGTRDRLFPIGGSETAIENIKKIYELAEAGSHFIPVIFDGKHEVDLTRALEFFRQEE